MRKKAFTLLDAYRIARIDPFRTSYAEKLLLNELFEHCLACYSVSEEYGDLDLVKDLEIIGERGRCHRWTCEIPG